MKFDANDIKNINKSYGPIRALDNINLTIRDGEFFSLLGPSGSGKTTCLKVIAGLLICLNSVINPYIYVSCSKSYREAFLQALHFKTDTKSSDIGTKPVTIAQTRFQGENCA